MERNQLALLLASIAAAACLGLSGGLVHAQHWPSRMASEAAPAPTLAPPASARGPNTDADLQQPGYALADLLQLGLQQNPELLQAALRVEGATGRALQAGLYPNPQFAVEGSELGNRNGPGGFITAPLVSQELVTAGKLRLSRQVAEHETDQASLELLAQQFTLITAVRCGYFETLAAQRRVEIYRELVQLAGQATETTEALVRGRQAAPLDLLQVRIELNRFRADLDAAHQQRVAEWRRLAATLGVPDLPDASLRGTLDVPWPDYQFESAAQEIAACHPNVRAARIGVARSQAALQRARVAPIPNVTVGAGYQRDNIDQQDLWTFRASVPIPVFDRNQGNVVAANADAGRAVADVQRVQNELLARLATSFGQYQGARQRAERYRSTILPDALEAYQQSLAAFQGGQFEYLRVLQAQRVVAETKLEYVRMLTELWLAASDIAGLLLEEEWPAD